MTLGLFVITNAICDWVQTWVLLPLGPKSLNLVDSASQPPAYSQGAEKSGKKFPKEKKRKKRRIIWIFWILIDQSVPVWNLLFVIKVLILQSGSFQFPPLAAEGGSERQADLKK